MKPGNCPFSTCWVRCWPATFKGCVSKPPGAIFGSRVAAGLFRLAMEMSPRSTASKDSFLNKRGHYRLFAKQNNEANDLESKLVDTQKLFFLKMLCAYSAYHMQRYLQRSKTLNWGHVTYMNLTLSHTGAEVWEKLRLSMVCSEQRCFWMWVKHLIPFGNETWWQIKHLIPLVQSSPCKPNCHKLWNLWEMVMSDIPAMASR